MTPTVCPSTHDTTSKNPELDHVTRKELEERLGLSPGHAGRRLPLAWVKNKAGVRRPFKYDE